MPINNIRRNNRRYALGNFGGVPLYYPTDNLVGVWRPSVSSGSTLLDISGNGFNGTLAGTSPSTFSPSSLGPQKVQFSGTTSYVSFAAAASNFDNASFSAGGWFLLGLSSATICPLMDCNNQTNYGWVLNLNQGSGGNAAAGYATMYLYNGSWQAACYTNTALITAGSWIHHLRDICDGGFWPLCMSTGAPADALLPVNQQSPGTPTYSRLEKTRATATIF